jgi:hypothetical protein
MTHHMIFEGYCPRANQLEIDVQWIAEQGYPPPPIYASSQNQDIWPITSQNVTKIYHIAAQHIAVDLTPIISIP